MNRSVPMAVAAESSAKPEAFAAPMTQLAHVREFPDESFRTVVRANVDTLYSPASLEPSAKPTSFNMTLRMYWPTDKPPMVTWLR